MRRGFCGIALLFALGLATAARADGSAYSDPYAQPAHGLRFADLEAAMGTDPRLWSADPRWDAHHTPAAMLAPATAALRAAVATGTPAARAVAILERAGARCTSSATALDCRYHTVETPFSGADFDNVTWRVRLGLAGGQVSDLSVTRDWTRR